MAAGLRNSVWAYPLVNTGHIFGIALLVGGSAPLSLRILGAWKAVPLGPLRKALSRLVDAGFLLALACGFLLFSARANAYARSSLFLATMLLLLLLLLAAWLTVLTLGRLIGYL